MGDDIRWGLPHYQVPTLRQIFRAMVIVKAAVSATARDPARENVQTSTTDEIVVAVSMRRGSVHATAFTIGLLGPFAKGNVFERLKQRCRCHGARLN